MITCIKVTNYRVWTKIRSVVAADDPHTQSRSLVSCVWQKCVEAFPNGWLTTLKSDRSIRDYSHELHNVPARGVIDSLR